MTRGDQAGSTAGTGSGRVTALWAHQQDAISAVERRLAAGERSMTVEIATGAGRSVTAANTIARVLEAGTCTRALLMTGAASSAHQFARLLDTVELATGGRFGERYSVFSGPDALTSVQAMLRPNSATGEAAPTAAYACIATNAQLRALAEPEADSAAREALFDLVVVDGSADLDILNTLTRQCDPIFIHFMLPGTRAAALSAPLVYRYGLQDAIADNVLADSAAARPRPAFARSDQPPPRAGNVFLAYVPADKAAARRIGADLTDAGFRVLGDVLDEYRGLGADARSAILGEIRAGDSLVYLLSPDSVEDPLLEAGLGAVLDRRGAQLVPTVIRNYPIPKALADRAVVDATANTDTLIKSLRWTDAIDLAALDGRRFHALAADLLRRIGFALEPAHEQADLSIDYRAVYHERLGFADPVDYLIQIKQGIHARVSIRGALAAVNARGMHDASHLLLVTGVQLTSAARASIEHAALGGPRIRVLDGPRIIDMLLDHPDLVRTHFLHEDPAGVADA